MPGVLEGKAVAITGAGSGLGRAYALAAGAAGAVVAVGDVDADAAHRTVADLAEMGVDGVAASGDIADPDAARAVVHACVDHFGAIDGLVNNAGVSRVGPSWEATDAEVARLIGVNLTGVISATHAALPRMIAQGRGSVINIVSGALLGMPDIALYGGTKAGVLGLTYGWALEAAGTGVRVNALSPLANTSMSDLMEGVPDRLKGPPPEQIAPVVVALLAPGAEHLNGQLIRFDGARLGLMAPPGKGAGVEREVWDAEQITDAFAGELRPHLQRLGLGGSTGQ